MHMLSAGSRIRQLKFSTLFQFFLLFCRLFIASYPLNCCLPTCHHHLLPCFYLLHFHLPLHPSCYLFLHLPLVTSVSTFSSYSFFFFHLLSTLYILFLNVSVFFFNHAGTTQRTTAVSCLPPRTISGTSTTEWMSFFVTRPSTMTPASWSHSLTA